MKLLQEMRLKYIHLNNEIEITNDLICTVDGVEVSEKQLAELDAKLSKQSDEGKEDPK